MQNFYISREMNREGYTKTVETLLNNKEAIITLGSQYEQKLSGFVAYSCSSGFDDEYAWECLRQCCYGQIPASRGKELSLRFFLRNCLNMYLYINKDSFFTKKEIYTLESGIFTHSFIHHEGCMYKINYKFLYQVNEVYVGDFLINDMRCLLTIYSSEDGESKDYIQLQNLVEGAKFVVKGDFKSLRRAIATGIVNINE